MTQRPLSPVAADLTAAAAAMIRDGVDEVMMKYRRAVMMP